MKASSGMSMARARMTGGHAGSKTDEAGVNRLAGQLISGERTPNPLKEICLV